MLGNNELARLDRIFKSLDAAFSHEYPSDTDIIDDETIYWLAVKVRELNDTVLNLQIENGIMAARYLENPSDEEQI